LHPASYRWKSSRGGEETAAHELSASWVDENIEYI
jgi:hypothetical protein